jgi:TPR repeat protein
MKTLYLLFFIMVMHIASYASTDSAGHYLQKPQFSYPDYLPVLFDTALINDLLKDPIRDSTNTFDIYKKSRDGVSDYNKAIVYFKYDDNRSGLTFLIQAAKNHNTPALDMLGVIYVRSGAYNSAFRFFTEAAKQNYAPAQANLGLMYDLGLDMGKDEFTAQKWYSKATQQHYPPALSSTAYNYLNGSGGLIQNSDTAIKYYFEAADSGNYSAIYNLIYMYKKKLGDWDDKRADKLYTAVAKIHSRNLLYNLGKHLVQVDSKDKKRYVKGVKLLTEAADSGSISAAIYLGYMYGIGLGVDSNDYIALKWYSKAAEQHDAQGLYAVATYYQKGLGGLSVDSVMAFKYLLEAADSGDRYAISDLIIMYQKKWGTWNNENADKLYTAIGKTHSPELLYRLAYCFFKDDSKGQDRYLKLFTEAADSGSIGAAIILGYIYGTGKGIDTNYLLSVKWYTKAAQQHSPEGLFALAIYYQKGIGGLSVDSVKASKYLLEAADSGYAEAQLNAGYLYLHSSATNQLLAEKYYKKAADQHNPDGLFSLGVLYSHGTGGMPQDSIMALRYFVESADSGNIEAQIMAGYMYSKGWGAKRDLGITRKWYEKAADKNNPKALFSLGEYYYSEIPIKDYDSAFIYFKKSADSGYSKANAQLGYMYEKGLGTNVNSHLADKYYRKAAEEGNSIALYNIGMYYKNGKDSFTQSYDSAFIYLKKSADLDFSPAELEIGQIYENGIGRDTNNQLAVKYYRKAANQNNIAALSRMAIFYNHGRGGLPHNNDSALIYNYRSAIAGYADAQVDRGDMYSKGIIVGIDKAKAALWYRAAANQHNRVALYDMGHLFLDGSSVIPRNLDSAYRYFQEAADSGYNIAQLEIGYMFEKGLSVEMDAVVAEKWYKKAADQNNQIALCNLGFLYKKGKDKVPQNDSLANYYFMKSAVMGNAKAQLNVGYMYQHGANGTEKDTNKALLWYDKAAQQHLADALNTYAWLCYIKKINLDKAMRYSKEAVEIQPDDIHKLDTYASILFWHEEYEKAEKYQNRALAGGGDKKGGYVERYGDIQFKLGKQDEAMKYWKMAMDMPGHSDKLTDKIANGKYME